MPEDVQIVEGMLTARPKPIFTFEPEEDITALELARLLKAANLQVFNEDIFETLPEDMRRHFKKYPEDPGEE